MKKNLALELSANTTVSFHARLKTFFSKYTPAICSFLLAALFIYAALNKLIVYKQFIAQLKDSPITKGHENTLAWLAPGMELLIALFLLVNRSRLLGLWSAFFLMLLFTAYVFLLLHKYPLLPCSCGGIISKLSWNAHFYFNLGFTLLAMLALSLYNTKK
jgi:hypothetical protein